jgi:metal-responsive CopG/Arc/MetJ family transcriptional regulator
MTDRTLKTEGEKYIAFSITLPPDDLALLDRIKEQAKIKTRSEVVRLAVRMYSRAIRVTHRGH